MEPKKEKVSWFSHEKSAATDTENLFFALLVIKNAERVDELDEWAKEVLEYESAFLIQKRWMHVHV